MRKQIYPVLLVIFTVFRCGATHDTGGDTGTGWDVLPDGSDPAADLPETGSDLGIDFLECVGVTEVASNRRGPADVIFVIDNTPSMYNEIEMVRANMNELSDMVEAEGLDLHIVMISCLPGDCGTHDDWFGICIDPPVGADGGCPEGGPWNDTNPPGYLHISEPIPSTKGLSKAIETYDLWKDMVRPGVSTHFVFISDDGDDWTAAQFNTELLALDPAFAGYKAHGIFSYLSKEAACAISDTHPCCIYAAPDGEGAVYRDLAALTGGVTGDMCLQDFDPIFNEFAEAIIESAALSCEWEIPEPPVGETLESDLVNVWFQEATGTDTIIGRVDFADQCSLVSSGWYYDDPLSPTTIFLCPQTCEWIQGHEGSSIQIQFGCETQEAII